MDDETEIELPRVGTRFSFAGGDIVLAHVGVCEVIRAEIRPNAVGRLGGRIWFVTPKGEEATVTLSYYQNWAREIAIPPA